MPYTLKQHKLFEYVKHNPQQAYAKGIKIKPKDAAKMASEGVKNAKSKRRD
jgi:hypothetical protein